MADLRLAMFVLAPLVAHAETPADYGCDRPVTLAYYEFGPLYHSGAGIDPDVVDELAKRTGCGSRPR